MIYDCCFVRNFNPEFFVLTLDWDQTSVSFNNKAKVALPSSEKQDLHWWPCLHFNIFIIH